VVDQNIAMPAAFLSYARFNDEHDEERISYLRRRLADEVETVSGVSFEIFQDRRDIRVGQQWKDRIEQALDSTTLLIAFITPSFFASEYCRGELQQFLEREAQLRRDDLIIPVLYVPVPFFKKNAPPSADQLINVMKSRQAVDWTALRFQKRGSEEMLAAINALANQIEAIVGPLRDLAARAAAASVATVGSETAGSRPPAERVVQSDAIAERARQATTPIVRVVDALRGPHRAVTEAVAAASPGDRILVRPGTYEGGIVLDKPLEIVGEGNPSEVVIHATGTNALAFRTTLGRVANLALKQLGGGDYFAVDVGQGRLTLEGCHIESASLAGVAIHGAEAEPILRNNRIQRCVQSGVIVFDSARGQLEENDIASNRAFGIVVRGGAAPVLRGNRVHDNEYGGVQVDGGAGRIEDNVISSNRAEGMLVSNEAAPLVQRNRIFKNVKAGIYVYDRGAPTVKENQIFDNLQSGIAIRTGGNPVIQENTVSGNNGKGVWCSDQATGVVENNTLRGNIYGAFWKSPDSTTRYVNNRDA
jgi:parallel beta-helix repeat protein